MQSSPSPSTLSSKSCQQDFHTGIEWHVIEPCTYHLKYGKSRVMLIMMMSITPFEPGQRPRASPRPWRCHGWNGRTWRAINTRMRHGGAWLARVSWRRLVPHCPRQTALDAPAQRSARRWCHRVPRQRSAPGLHRCHARGGRHVPRAPPPERLQEALARTWRTAVPNMSMGAQPGGMGRSHHTAQVALPHDIVGRGAPADN